MEENLTTYAENQALQACKYEAFKAINLPHIKSTIAEMLGQIGRNGIFDEYTKHDISHVNTMLTLLDDIIPSGTKEIMTDADWLLIVLSIYFHDLGMLVTKKEFNDRNKSQEFVLFKNKYIENLNNRVSISVLNDEDKEKFIYQEFVRKYHGERIYSWISGEKSRNAYYDDNVTLIIKDLVKDFKPLFRNDIAILCASHLKDDIDNLEKYKVTQAYGMSRNEKGNVLYAALLLRTADLLHITSNRTPSIEFQIISPTNPISQTEWAKQAAISSVTPKIAEDKDGNKDESLPKDTFEVNAYFENDKGFFSLIEYLKYVKEQLKENFKINEKAKKKFASKYDYPWKDIDDSTIQTKNFDRHQLSFTIDQNKVLKLLVGETLYNNLSVSLRELAQNSIDAVKVKQFELKEKHIRNYEPKIQVYWYSDKRELIIRDNGTGMDLDIIQNHLLKVGSSRYQDTNFQKEHPGYKSISRFGIGLLTCFLIADDVDILTNMDSKNKPLLLKIRNVHGKYLLKHGEEEGSNLTLNNETGTAIKLRVRPDVKNFYPLYILKYWILIPNCDFTYIENGVSTKIGFANPHDLIDAVIKSKLSTKEYSNYKVEDFSANGIEMSLLLRYNKDMNEWAMVPSNSLPLDNNDVEPFGISIEGIRIDNYTPGFKGQTFVAYANMTGENAPKTNVARSTINGSDMSYVLQTLYGLYFEYIEKQINNLRKEFSITWVSDEIYWMLNSFLSSKGRWGYPGFINSDILKEKLLDLNAILVEKEENRSFCSLNKLREIGHYWTIESEAFNSANDLIKEIKSSNKSVISLLSLLYGEEDSYIKDYDIVLCKNRFPDLLDEVMLSNFQISEISLIKEQRRLDLKWEIIDEDLWTIIKNNDNIIRKRAFSSGSKTIEFIIQKKGVVNFNNGGTNYDAIHSSYGTIIPLGSKLSEYLIKILDSLDLSKENEYGVAFNLCVFFENVLSYHITEKKELEKMIELQFEKSNDYEFYEFVFEKLDYNELLTLCLESNFSIYDPTKWYRKYMSN